jgi:hypothetical protein
MSRPGWLRGLLDRCFRPVRPFIRNQSERRNLFSFKTLVTPVGSMLGSPLRWRAIVKELTTVVFSQRTALNRNTSGIGFKYWTNGLANTRSTCSFTGQYRNYSALSHPQSSSVNTTARNTMRLDPRFFSSNANPTQDPSLLPVLSSPGVGRWLMGSALLVFSVIVVGGVTRLTESGLSITEWRPITGIIPPLSQGEWTVEFEKYKATPEFKLCVLFLLT